MTKLNLFLGLAINEALAKASALFASSASLVSSDTEKLDAELLLQEVLHKNRAYLYTWPERLLSNEQSAIFTELVNRRLHGEPVAYIIGYREFWSLMLKVSPATLIPRPDTEVLVETALNKVIAEQASVLDLGTGTGAIALALASENPDWNVCAVDYSQAAVALATENATRLGLQRVCIQQSDWFHEVSGLYDLIVSNPPYIEVNDPHLNQGDVKFEPKSALTSGVDGLMDIRLIATQAQGYLKDQGWLMIEHGYNQGEAVREIYNSLNYKSIQTVTDYSGNERVTCALFSMSKNKKQ